MVGRQKQWVHNYEKQTDSGAGEEENKCHGSKMKPDQTTFLSVNNIRLFCGWSLDGSN